MSRERPISSDSDLQDPTVSVKEICSACQKPRDKRDDKTARVDSDNICTCDSSSDTQDKSDPGDSADTPNAAEEKPLQLPTMGDGYEILASIGQGGMGAVYKARDRDGKTRAVKFLRRELAEDAVALKRFEKEAESVSRLDHANLVAVYEHGRAPDGVPYLVMEFLDGSNLGDLLEKEGNLSPERALPTFLEICEGLIYAHQNDVIHRDIKPTNVIIGQKKDGGIESVRLVDFGISTLLPNASRETRDLTQTGEVFGSPYYMSPEQCLGFMLDQRSDIYSFGCLMYETLTGKTPFAGSNPIQLVVKHINEDVAPFPQELKGSRLMAGLEQVVMRCLEKEQALRYQSVEALKADLEKVRDGKPIPRYSTGKKVKPTLTKRQTIGAIALTFGLMFYICFTSSLISSSIPSKIAPGLLGLIGAAGVYAFLSAGFERLRTLWRANGTSRQWFLMFTLLAIGMAGLTLAPYAISAVLFEFSSSPHWMEQLMFIGHASHAFWMLAICAALLGYIAIRSPVKIGAPTFILRLTGIIIILLCTSLAFPKQSAKIPKALAESSTKGFPQVSVELYKLSVWLDPDRYVASTLSQLQSEQGDVAGALATLERVDRDQLSDMELRHLAELYRRTGQPQKAVAIVNYLLGRGQRNPDARCLRGAAYAQLGKYKEAMQDLDSAYRDNPFEPTFNKYKIAALCAQGEYDKALTACNTFLGKMKDIKHEDSMMEANIIKAAIFEKLGNRQDMLASYNAAVENYNALKIIDESNNVAWHKYKSTYGYDYLLAAAFAMYKVGNEASIEMLDSIKDQKNSKKEDLVCKLNMEDSKLDFSW